MISGQSCDIDIAIFARNEGHLLGRSLRSVDRAIAALGSEGLVVSARVILSGDDERTLAWLSERCSLPVLRVGNAGLGTTRDAAAAQGAGRFVAFIDACDMWSANFLVAAVAAASAAPLVVWRPAVSIGYPDVYYNAPLFCHRVAPDSESLAPSSLLVENPYPSTFLAERRLLEMVPFPREDERRGWTEIDWWWCANLAGGGIAQKPVPETLHYFRNEPSVRSAPTGRIGPTTLERPGWPVSRKP